MVATGWLSLYDQYERANVKCQASERSQTAKGRERRQIEISDNGLQPTAVAMRNMINKYGAQAADIPAPSAAHHVGRDARGGRGEGGTGRAVTKGREEEGEEITERRCAPRLSSEWRAVPWLLVSTKRKLL